MSRRLSVFYPFPTLTWTMTPEIKLPKPDDWIYLALISSTAYGLAMGIFFSVQLGRYDLGMEMGLIAGLLFGPPWAWVMRMFANRFNSKHKVERPDFGSESILVEGPANHFKGIEGVGGYLWVTDARVHFRSHSVNFQNHEWTCPLSKIQDARATKTVGLFNNGLRLKTFSGKEHRFTVYDNRGWAEVLQKLLQPIQ